MSLPDVLRQHVEEAHAVEHGALIHRIGPEEAVDIIGAEVRHHFRRRHGADLDVLVGIEAMFGDVVAQQIIVHRIVERHRELHAFPRLRIALVLVLDCECDGLTIDVLDRRRGIGDRIRAYAERNGDRHRRQHMGGVIFFVDGLVADHRPAGSFDHVDVETVLLVEAHGLRHDDRRGASDRNEADLKIFLLDGAVLREHLGRCSEREELRDRSERGRGADRFEESAARDILRKHRPHHRRGDDALVTLVFAFNRRALQLRRGVPLVLDLADVAAARAAGAVQSAFGSKGLSNVDIATPPSLPPRQRRGGASMILQWPCQSTGANRRGIA